MAKTKLHGTRTADQLLRRLVMVPKDKVDARIEQKRKARLKAKPTSNPPKK